MRSRRDERCLYTQGKMLFLENFMQKRHMTDRNLFFILVRNNSGSRES